MKKHKNINWHVFSYRHTGDDMVVLTDGFRWVAYDFVGLAAVNDLSDSSLRIFYAAVKYDLASFDTIFSAAYESSFIPCGYDFGVQFDRFFRQHLAMICEGV